ncbi:Type III secretion inner membrane protein (plasmid) [Sinorhizobium fredii CCBAU 83666]|nr:Type III secretion inner membrane protein [Sinorhizobium fredii CCBAU 83666]
MMMLRRFAPQFKSGQLSPPIKNIVFPIIMVTYATYLLEGIKLEITQADGTLGWLDKLLK